jgi:hypothetical protein
MLMQNLEVQLVRPPVPVRRATAGYLFAGFARYRAIAVLTHLRPPFLMMFYKNCIAQNIEPCKKSMLFL